MSALRTGQAFLLGLGLAAAVRAGEGNAPELVPYPLAELRAKYAESLPAKANLEFRREDDSAFRVVVYAEAERLRVEVNGSTAFVCDRLRQHDAFGMTYYDGGLVKERVDLFSEVLRQVLKQAFGSVPELRDRVVGIYVVSGLEKGSVDRAMGTTLGLAQRSKPTEQNALTIIPHWLHESSAPDRAHSTAKGLEIKHGGRLRTLVTPDGWLKQSGTNAAGVEGLEVTLMSREAWDGAFVDSAQRAFAEDAGAVNPQLLETEGLAACMSVLLHALKDVPRETGQRAEKIEETARAAFSAVMTEHCIETPVLTANRVVALFYREKEADLRGKPKEDVIRAVEQLVTEHVNGSGRALTAAVIGRAGGLGFGPMPELDEDAVKAVLSGFSRAYGETVAARVGRIVRWRLREHILGAGEGAGKGPGGRTRARE